MDTVKSSDASHMKQGEQRKRCMKKYLYIIIQIYVSNQFRLSFKTRILLQGDEARVVLDTTFEAGANAAAELASTATIATFILMFVDV